MNMRIKFRRLALLGSGAKNPNVREDQKLLSLHSQNDDVEEEVEEEREKSKRVYGSMTHWSSFIIHCLTVMGH